MVDFRLRNVVAGRNMPVHTDAQVVSSIINAVGESSPALIRYNFAEDTNIGNVQHFEPEHYN